MSMVESKGEVKGRDRVRARAIIWVRAWAMVRARTASSRKMGECEG